MHRRPPKMVLLGISATRGSGKGVVCLWDVVNQIHTIVDPKHVFLRRISYSDWSMVRQWSPWIRAFDN